MVPQTSFLPGLKQSLAYYKHGLFLILIPLFYSGFACVTVVFVSVGGVFPPHASEVGTLPLSPSLHVCFKLSAGRRYIMATNTNA